MRFSEYETHLFLHKVHWLLPVGHSKEMSKKKSFVEEILSDLLLPSFFSATYSPKNIISNLAKYFESTFFWGVRSVRKG